tara:strand:- start:4215 stop:4541 length:327 start_codon:yes stop_codon:yes gene_type:complete
MGCNCKNVRDTTVPEGKLMNQGKGINTNIIFKWLIFIGMAILSPLFLPPFIYFLYKLIITRSDVDASFFITSGLKLVKTYMMVNKYTEVYAADLEVYDEKSELSVVNV